MHLERIEQALRDGPPDEPVYVPGSFRRSRPSAWWFALAGATMTAAVVIGIAIGIGFGAIRGTPVGGPQVPVATDAELQGTWVSDEISLERWVDELLERGFDPNDVGNFLVHDPFDRSARYLLTFDEGRVTISADYDDTGPQVLGFGAYTLEGGVYSYVETTVAPTVIGEPCQVLATPVLVEPRLEWRNVELRGCGVEPRIAHTVFFDLLPYTRDESE